MEEYQLTPKVMPYKKGIVLNPTPRSSWLGDTGPAEGHGLQSPQ